MKSIFYSLILVVAITHVAIAQKTTSQEKSLTKVIVIERSAHGEEETRVMEPSESQDPASLSDIKVTIVSQPTAGEKDVIQYNDANVVEQIDPDDIESVDVIRKGDKKEISITLKPGVDMPVIELPGRTPTRTIKAIATQDEIEATVTATEISEVIHITLTEDGDGQTHSYTIVTDGKPCDAGNQPQSSGSCMVSSPCCLLQPDEESSEQPYLGLQLRERDGILEVTEVIENSPALTAGFMVGDILDKVAQTDITTLGTLTKAMAQVSVNDKLKIKVIRDGKKEKLSLVTGTRPAEARSCCGGKCCQAKQEMTSVEKLKKVIVIQPDQDTDIESGTPAMILTEDIIQLSTYPNPAVDQLTVDFMAPAVDQLRMRLMDESGRASLEILESPYEGAFSESLPVKDLPPGIYYLRIDLDDQTITKKVVIGAGK